MLTRPQPITRREAIAALGGTVATLAGCLGSSSIADPNDPYGRLVARPSTPTLAAPKGMTPIPSLGVDAFLYVPATYTPDKPAPFAMMFHGAGHDAHELIDPFAPLAETRGLVLLATSSSNSTWDLSYNGGFSIDLVNLDKALVWAFQRVAVDMNRIGLIGFSDGATYVLALGRLNGDVVRRVAAYAPGYLAAVNPVGKPEFFITHGTQDQILSAANTRNVIVPRLRNDGYSVEHREWAGGHGVSMALANESLDWFTR